MARFKITEPAKNEKPLEIPKNRYLQDLEVYTYNGVGEKTYIYFVVARNSRTKMWKNRVKIGLSKSPEKRIATLQTGNASKLDLWYFFPVNVEKGRCLESHIHKKFKWSQDRNEWFKVYPCVRKFIKAHQEFTGRDPDLESIIKKQQKKNKQIKEILKHKKCRI